MGELREAARGHWRELMVEFGLPPQRLNGKHGPCPFCGGKDRFRFDDREGYGRWICSQCNDGRGGDGISFVMLMHRVDFHGARKLIEPRIGLTSFSRPKSEPTEEDKRGWRNKLWTAAKPVTIDDPVGRFLQARAGVLSYPTDLRCHPSLHYRDDQGRTTRHPAMLSIIRSPDGMPANLHRTWLAPHGGKANVEDPRRMMPGDIPVGSAIRLMPAGEELGIAEGIETAFAAAALHNIPTWSAVDAGKLSKWQPPAGIRRVVIFGDNDSSFTGQDAAYGLAKRLRSRGLAVEVRIPQYSDEDWADVWLHRNEVQAPAVSLVADASF